MSQGRGLSPFKVAALILALQSTTAHAALCPPPAPAGGADPVDDCGLVFRVECPAQGRVLTGFKARVGDGVGIVTALHGVLGCSDLTAFNLRDSYAGLRLAKVDIALDAAFLSSTALEREGEVLQTTGALGDEELRVVGYPQGLRHQFSHRIELHIQPFRRLFELLPDAERNALSSRGSPDIQENVMSLSGAIQNGYSGAPILTWDGRAVGIANGGLRGGTVDIGWAMPVRDLDWEDARTRRSELMRLAGGGPLPLFGADASPIADVPVFYLTDAGDSTGKIYRVRDGRIRRIYARARGRLYSVAVAPDGTVYFSNHNDNHIYRLLLPSGEEARVYTHDTYTRDVEFDSEGRLYFSESTGAGGDGTVYRLDLESRVARPVFSVKLAQVDGYWAGNFAFAPDGSLWLSSGNRVPASLYKVEAMHPRRMFTSSGSIRGFAFTGGGHLLYADWRQRVHRIELPGFVVSEVLEAPDLKWASDVAISAGPGTGAGTTPPRSERQVAATGDWVQVLSVVPPADGPMPYGRAVRFVLELAYSLRSARKARLVVSVGQLPASARGCEGGDGELVDAGETVISEGKGKATVKVTWSGGKSAKRKRSEGHLAFYPSIWKTGGHERIAYFGKAPGYCYRFGR